MPGLLPTWHLVYHVALELHLIHHSRVLLRHNAAQPLHLLPQLLNAGCWCCCTCRACTVRCCDYSLRQLLLVLLLLRLAGAASLGQNQLPKVAAASTLLLQA